MSINRGMDKEDRDTDAHMLHTQWSFQSAVKENKTVTFSRVICRKVAKLEIIIPSKINQTQKDKCHVFSHLQDPDLNRRGGGGEANFRVREMGKESKRRIKVSMSKVNGIHIPR